MTADGLRSHLIVAFLDLYEIARLQVAFSNLDRDLRDPDSRCELMASSPGLERATVGVALADEERAVAIGERAHGARRPATVAEVQPASGGVGRDAAEWRAACARGGMHAERGAPAVQRARVGRARRLAPLVDGDGLGDDADGDGPPDEGSPNDHVSRSSNRLAARE